MEATYVLIHLKNNKKPLKYFKIIPFWCKPSAVTKVSSPKRKNIHLNRDQKAIQQVEMLSSHLYADYNNGKEIPLFVLH